MRGISGTAQTSITSIRINKLRHYFMWSANWTSETKFALTLIFQALNKPGNLSEISFYRGYYPFKIVYSFYIPETWLSRDKKYKKIKLSFLHINLLNKVIDLILCMWFIWQYSGYMKRSVLINLFAFNRLDFSLIDLLRFYNNFVMSS